MLLRLWVAFHLFSIIVWSLPKQPRIVAMGTVEPELLDWPMVWADTYLRPSDSNNYSHSLVSHYVLWTGFWQSWDMFAPDPARNDVWSDQIVQFADGTAKVHKYPRVYDYPVLERYFVERYRKFFERAAWEQQAYLWPAFAQRTALLEFRDPANPPVKVWLRRHIQPLPRPMESIKEQYRTEIYFVYDVDLVELKKAGPQ